MASKHMQMVRTTALHGGIAVGINWVIWQIKGGLVNCSHAFLSSFLVSPSALWSAPPAWCRVQQLKPMRELQDAQTCSQQQQPRTSKPMSQTTEMSLHKQRTAPEQ